MHTFWPIRLQIILLKTCFVSTTMIILVEGVLFHSVCCGAGDKQPTGQLQMCSYPPTSAHTFVCFFALQPAISPWAKLFSLYYLLQTSEESSYGTSAGTFRPICCELIPQTLKNKPAKCPESMWLPGLAQSARPQWLRQFLLLFPKLHSCWLHYFKRGWKFSEVQHRWSYLNTCWDATTIK